MVSSLVPKKLAVRETVISCLKVRQFLRPLLVLDIDLLSEKRPSRDKHTLPCET